MKSTKIDYNVNLLPWKLNLYLIMKSQLWNSYLIMELESLFNYETGFHYDPSQHVSVCYMLMYNYVSDAPPTLHISANKDFCL